MSRSPQLTRRVFQSSVGSVLLGGAVVVPLTSDVSGAQGAEAKQAPTGTGPACDFRSSFMTWDVAYRKDTRPDARHNMPHGNMARIQLDALIDVIDRRSGQSERFVLIAPCRTEWVYAEDRLFHMPNEEYRKIYSLSEDRSMGQAITDSGRLRRARKVSGVYRSLKIDVCTSSRTRQLLTPAEIVKATGENLPLVGRTRLDDPDGNRHYVLEYPIKTMNFQPVTNSFQVDTGPLLIPDFDSQAESVINRLAMAHVAYNRLDRAEFILRRPTEVQDEQGKSLCQVLHYSEVREDKTQNVILTAETS